MAGGSHLPRRRRVLAAAVAGFALVFALRSWAPRRATASRSSTSSRSSSSRSSTGRSRCRAGLAAVALFAVWDATTDNHVTFVAYLRARCSFVLVRWLTGRMANRLRAAADQAASAARHFELARDLLCTANLDGHLVELNGAWEETLGWSREELTAKPFAEFVHPDDRERTARSAAALRAGERPERLVNRYLTKDGGYRWIEWSSSFDAEHGPDLRGRARRHRPPRGRAAHARGRGALPALVRGLADRHGARRRARRAASSRSTRRSSTSRACRARSSSAPTRSRSWSTATTSTSCARGSSGWSAARCR